MTDSVKKQGFTLAEVMIVLLVLTILFAAFAPFITKRKRNATAQEIWRWSSRSYLSGPMDTYYQPNDDNNLGGFYIGTTPNSDSEIYSLYSPLSKLIIRSGFISDNRIQRHLQLRYGRSNFEDPGQLAAVFLADNSNLLFGSNYAVMQNKENRSKYPSNNVAFGFDAMNSMKSDNVTDNILKNNTAFGYKSYTSAETGKDNTMIGAEAGASTVSGGNNTLIGYAAGTTVGFSDNTLIGYNSQSAIGHYNTLIGANTGNPSNLNIQYNKNVGIGYNTLKSVAHYSHKISETETATLIPENNVAIGAGALGNLTSGKNNTAIGYNACFGVTNESNITCIGANSGPAPDSPVRNELAIKFNDGTLRTYIGSNPNLKNKTNTLENAQWQSSGRYGGDAVLELHNSIGEGNRDLINEPQIISNATTIINGNLIVRGRTFFTIGNNLYPFYYENNIFGTNKDIKCAENQLTYDFSNLDKCSVLSPITSDRRLKNIKSRNYDGLDKIKELKVYNYKFKDDKKKINHVGVIAQELEKVFPNSVFSGSDGYLKIRLDEMFYAAINSIKELNAKIISLTKNVLSIEKQIDKMEKENNKLKAQISALSARVEKLKNK